MFLTAARAILEQAVVCPPRWVSASCMHDRQMKAYTPGAEQTRVIQAAGPSNISFVPQIPCLTTNELGWHHHSLSYL